MRFARLTVAVWLVAQLPLVNIFAGVGCVGGIAGIVSVVWTRRLAQTLHDAVGKQATQIDVAIEQAGGTEAVDRDH